MTEPLRDEVARTIAETPANQPKDAADAVLALLRPRLVPKGMTPPKLRRIAGVLLNGDTIVTAEMYAETLMAWSHDMDGRRAPATKEDANE